MSRQPLKELFGIDCRALAVFRIGLGVLLLVDLSWRALDLSAFYTDFGVLPRDVLFSRPTVPGTFSFHMWSGSFAYVSLLFVLAGMLALCVLLGLFTKPALLLSWIFLISLHNRNEIILDGGDQLLRAFLFWSLFLPVGKRYSLDAIRKRTVPEGNWYCSMATVALLAQMVIIYEFAGFSKTDPIWFKEGTASFYVLASGQFTTPLGLALLQFPALLKFLTFATLFLEIVVPLFAFLPYHTGRIRVWIVTLFCLFHLGLFLSLEIGFFPIICMLGWLPFLPAPVWDRLERSPRLQAVGALFRRWFPTGSKQEVIRARCARSLVSDALVGFFLVFILVWNFKTFDTRLGRHIPAPLMKLARTLRLDQNWQLFSPRPPTELGWHVFVGTLCDGTQVDLLKGSGPVSWEQPERVSSIYEGYRWRKYFKLFLSEPFAENRLYYCQYLCRKWNRGQPQNPLRMVELYYLKTPLFPDQPSPPAERYLVWDIDCGDCLSR